MLWDGQNRKIIESDCWLTGPIYTDEDLIFEEKITGKWIGRNSKVLDLIQVEEEMAYDVIAIAAAASGIGLRRNFRKSRNC